MSVVQDFERYKKFNPARVAADAAKANDAAGSENKQDEAPTRTKGQINAANRERRAEGLAAAAKAKEEEKEAASALKRKAEELEDGQVPKRQDVESGEVVEDEKAELGDDFVEIIEDGRSVKVRKQE